MKPFWRDTEVAIQFCLASGDFSVHNGERDATRDSLDHTSIHIFFVDDWRAVIRIVVVLVDVIVIVVTV